MHALTPACLLDHLLAPTLAPLIPHAACLPCIQDLEALDWMLGTARTLHYLHTQLPFGAVVHRVGGVGGFREKGRGGDCIACIPNCPLGRWCTELVQQGGVEAPHQENRGGRRGAGVAASPAYPAAPWGRSAQSGWVGEIDPEPGQTAVIVPWHAGREAGQHSAQPPPSY